MAKDWGMKPWEIAEGVPLEWADRWTEWGVAQAKRSETPPPKPRRQVGDVREERISPNKIRRTRKVI